MEKDNPWWFLPVCPAKLLPKRSEHIWCQHRGSLAETSTVKDYKSSDCSTGRGLGAHAADTVDPLITVTPAQPRVCECPPPPALAVILMNRPHCMRSKLMLQHQFYSKTVLQEQNTKSDNEKAGHKRGPNVEIRYKMVTVIPNTPACEKAIRVQNRKTVYRKNERERSTGKEIKIVKMNGKKSI